MIFFGTITAIGAGVLQPLNMLVFGGLVGDMVEPTKDYLIIFEDFAFKNSLLGVGILCLTFVTTVLFNYSGTRQIYKIRSIYLEKALNQDVPWYDINQTGDFASRMSE